MMLAVGSFIFTGVLFLYRSVKVIVLIVIIFLSNVAIIKTSPQAKRHQSSLLFTSLAILTSLTLSNIVHDVSCGQFCSLLS